MKKNTEESEIEADGEKMEEKKKKERKKKEMLKGKTKIENLRSSQKYYFEWFMAIVYGYYIS